MASLPCVLTIAGSDASGGAGIQADLKTFSALGVYGTTVITAVTAQNTQGVQGVFPIEPYFVREQLESVFSDISVVGVKTGMLYDSAIIHQVVEVLKRYPSVPLVVDPVLVAKGGHRLLNEEALETLKSELFPLAALITPNIPEASVLVKRSLESLGQVREAAYELQRTGCRAVLVKGGHTIASSELQDACIDILVDEQGLEVYGKPRMDTLNTHGTGCTTAAAITAQLAKGISLREAIAVTKEYVYGCIEHSLSIGKGHGPLDHMYWIKSWQKQAMYRKEKG